MSWAIQSEPLWRLLCVRSIRWVVRFYINPDGLEWKRAKWAKPIQAYLKYSEKIMTRHADLVISDNPGIESYIKEAYPWSKTTYIAYGTDLSPEPA